MDTFRFSARVLMWRGVVVSIILLFSSGILQVPWAQTDPPSIPLNIACGSTQSYTDPSTGLTWVPDTQYITTGKTKTSLGSAPASPPNASGMGSLRYFDNQRSKHCYSLPVNSSSQPYNYYMIRASFFYGNYDQNALPPRFQLAMDGNIVANITMSDSINGQYAEFQWDSSNALLSGLIMKTTTRVNFGGTDLVRYPSDSHDYMWHPHGANSALLNLTTSPIEALSTTDTIKFIGSVHAGLKSNDLSTTRFTLVIIISNFDAQMLMMERSMRARVWCSLRKSTIFLKATPQS